MDIRISARFYTFVTQYPYKTMSVLTHTTVPSDNFKLEHLLDEDEGLRIEIERVIPLGEGIVPFLRVKGIGAEQVKRVITSDEDIEQAEILEEALDSVLVRVKWRDDAGTFLEALMEVDATCLRGSAREKTWYFTLRFQSREDLITFYKECVSQDVSLTVKSIHNSATPGNGHATDTLSDQQYETLCAALEVGYFSIPRETTLQELATQLGISDTATSQRIRRGLQKILEEELAASA